jgi:Putative DNA-binding domain
MTLVDLTPKQLAGLCRSGETLYVERKEREPDEGYGPAVAAFANRLGGWLLIGVTNTSEVVGCTEVNTSRVEIQDWLRHKLREDVDPLPPFAAEWHEHEGKVIGVVNVAESSDTPHVVKSTGSIYVREPGGKRPIAPVTDQRMLVELARRGEEARGRAEQRPSRSPHLWATMEPITELPDVEQHTMEMLVISAPLTVPPGFADRALSGPMQRLCEPLVDSLFTNSAPRDGPFTTRAEMRTAQNAFTMEARRGPLPEATSVGIDASGVVAARRVIEASTLALDELEEDTFPKLIRAVNEPLINAGALGRALCHLCLRGVKGQLVRGGGRFEENEVHVGRDLAIPCTDEEVRELARSWVRALTRASGEWQPESTPGEGG